MNRFSAIFFLMIIPASSFAQKLVLDTVIVNFKPDSISNDLSSVRIDTVFDERGAEDPALLDLSEKKQYLFIPVDQQILANRPVAEVIRNGFNVKNENSGESIHLGLRHLNFSSQKHYFFRTVSQLHASVFVYKKAENIGELLYECTIPRKLSGRKTRERYQSLVKQLVRRIGSDMIKVNSGTIQSLANYRKISNVNPWMQLRAGSEIAILTGSNFLMDATLTFAFPETKKSRLQSAGVMRYRDMDRFESIEWGIFTDWNHRYHPDWAMRFRSQLMFGLNRWNDMKTFKHKLYDAFLLEFSLGQSFQYHPKNRRSMTMGLGLIENVYYIYSTGARFDAGLMIQVGVQL